MDGQKWWYVTVRACLRPEFQLEEGENPLDAIRDEIVAGLDEIGVDADITDVGNIMSAPVSPSLSESASVEMGHRQEY